MDGFDFNVQDKLKFKFSIGGGASPSPEPQPSGASLTGTPIAVVMGVMGTAALTGDVEEE